MSDFLLALIGAALANNLALLVPLGIDPALRATGPRGRLHALGLATSLVLALTLPLALLLDLWLLQPLQAQSLRTWAVLSSAAVLIGPCLALLRRLRPALPVDGLGPLILLNGGLLGWPLQAPDASLVQALAWGLGGGLGFWLVLLLYTDLLERIDPAHVPLPFRGAPMVLLSAGLMGVALLGFAGMGRP
ncbi:MAG: Rnf-Nqr domain containing protein [Pseudomonas sp.]|uniref:Rnf-Nqr domain containing protein n=1 Tax=Pseudomonas sp. TaxID=306 RepID=UPI00339169B1